MINVFQPRAGQAELTAIGEVLSSSWLGAGEQVERFERAFADYVGCSAEEVQAVSSCTEGLFHAIAALGLGPGDEVVLPTVSFIGAAHAVRSVGARVALCDVEPATLNPSLEHVESVITPATKAILPLHFGGCPGAVAEIAALARERFLLLIEDAAVGLGSSVDGRACGTLGDLGLWSFDSMKVLTTGDGGMVRCADPEVTERIRRSTRLGLGPTGFGNRHDLARWWEIDPSSLGRRGTMNSIAAAMGLAQFGGLADSLNRRSEIAGAYDVGLRDLPWLSTPRPPDPGAAQIFYWIQSAAEIRDRLASHLLALDIYTTFKYWPLHRTRMYGSDREFPGADRAAESTLLLPLHQGLSDADVAAVLDAIHAFQP